MKTVSNEMMNLLSKAFQIEFIGEFNDDFELAYNNDFYLISEVKKEFSELYFSLYVYVTEYEVFEKIDDFDDIHNCLAFIIKH